MLIAAVLNRRPALHARIVLVVAALDALCVIVGGSGLGVAFPAAWLRQPLCSPQNHRDSRSLRYPHHVAPFLALVNEPRPPPPPVQVPPRACERRYRGVV